MQAYNPKFAAVTASFQTALAADQGPKYPKIC